MIFLHSQWSVAKNSFVQARRDGHTSAISIYITKQNDPKNILPLEAKYHLINWKKKTKFKKSNMEYSFVKLYVNKKPKVKFNNLFF